MANSPVHDIELEQALLGSILIRNDYYDAVSDLLAAEHFYEALHGRIYQAIGALIRMGRTASPISVGKVMAGDEGLTSVGGKQYLTDIAAMELVEGGVTTQARLIQEFWVLRGLIRCSEDMIATIKGGVAQTPASLVEQLEGQLHELTKEGGKVEAVRNAAVVIRDAITEAERAYRDPEAVGCSTGLPELDQILGHFLPSDLVVLGGVTSMGKTALAQQLTYNVATTGRRAMAFTLEMPDVQYMRRHLAQASGVPVPVIESGRCTEAQMMQIIEAEATFTGLPLGVDGSPRLRVDQIRSRVRRAIRKGGPVSLVMVDHLRFIEPVDARAFERDQLQQITRDLKAMAKELETCVLLVAHVNRESWRREDKTPQLSDLYGAAAIEQNADAVLFVHRPEYWLSRTRPAGGPELDEWTAEFDRWKGKAELIVAKRRRGPTGQRSVGFEATMTRFHSLLDEQTSHQKGLL